MLGTYESFSSAYLSGLREALERGDRAGSVLDPTSVGSAFGSRPRPSLELLGHRFRLTNPMASLFSSPVRAVNLPFCIGLLTWTLRGSDSVSEIGFYNPRGRDFSDDGISLRGAFGKRLFAWRHSLDQLELLAKRLEADPNSRRAVALIAGPEDNIGVTRDYPCALALQFLLRSGALHAFVLMRSQSAYSVLPYDVFLFTTLQSWLAARLRAPLGFYEHIAVSFHIYEDEVAPAVDALAAPCRSISVQPMSPNAEQTSQLLEFEQRCREAGIRKEAPILHALYSQLPRGSQSFEWEASRIVLSYAAHKAGFMDLSREVLRELRSELQHLLESSLGREEGTP